jgi:hypothetical protein
MNKKLILMLILMSMLTPTTFANTSVITSDCATMSTKATFLKSNEYRIRLFHLGKVKSIISLAPGRHKLSAQVLHKQTNILDDQYTIELVKNNDASAMINFELDVKKNTLYRIIATTKGNHNRKSNRAFEISIKKELSKLCENDKQTEHQEVPINNTHINTIPETLQYRLDLVMMDLKAYFRSKNLINKTVTIKTKPRIINTIGIVTNKETPVTEGINILAITPFSIAAKMGLRPDDTILNINGVDLASDNRIQNKGLSILTRFKNTIVNLSEDESVKIQVLRKNKKVILHSDYKELSLPSYKLKIMMN